jgi:energy-coupling factor transporter ATP-binding protein EcfA2
MEVMNPAVVDVEHGYGYTFKHAAQYYKSRMKAFLKSTPEIKIPQEVLVSWTEEQEKILSFFKKRIESSDGEHTTAVIVGVSGCGKTTVLQQIKYLLHQNKQKYIFTTPTGNLAVEHGYVTLHHALGLTKYDCKKNWFTLASESDISELAANRLRDIDWFFIDEFSQVSPSFLNYAAMVLQKAKGSSRPWGGVNVVLCGDMSQIKGFGLTLFSDIEQEGEKYDFAREGLELYRSIKDIFCLKGSQRHAKDPQFYNLLQNIRKKTFTEEDFALLESRMEKNLDFGSRCFFDCCVLICPRNYTVKAHNEDQLDRINKSVYK